MPTLEVPPVAQPSMREAFSRVGKHVTELVPPDRREAVRQDFPGLFNRESTLLESESLTKDGHVVPIELAACPCEYEGKVAVLLHVSRRRRERPHASRRRRLA
ncbi:MAG: PAS domain S-box protein [Proteobacteria bacterium]|nr:PAS domain S-box protein [Pseudomonadota bacterium]